MPTAHRSMKWLRLTKRMAAELGTFGVGVNCISPWAVRTPPLRLHSGLDDEQLEAWDCRFPRLKGVTLGADDIAEATLVLASDKSKYVSGHSLAVDGGTSVMNSGFNISREQFTESRKHMKIASFMFHDLNELHLYSCT
ncbi:unnamed protein product [Victoria cruziana]